MSNMDRSLTRIEREHQKLATLSSYNPLFMGNTLTKTWINVLLYINGAKISKNVNTTVNPTFTNLYSLN